MKKERLLLTPFMLLLFCMGVQAQKVNITKHPGYIDLEDIKIPDSAEEITDINLGPALLALARLGGEDEDEDISKGLAGILSIRVKSYEVGYDDAGKIRPVMDRLEKKLEAEEWERLVRSKSRDELTNISMKIVEGKIVGFFLMSIEPGEGVTFVNVVGGNIDLESIKNLGMGLNDSALDSLKSIKRF